MLTCTVTCCVLGLLFLRGAHVHFEEEGGTVLLILAENLF